MLYCMTKLTYNYHATSILALEQSIHLILALSSLTHLRVHFDEPLSDVKICLDFWYVLGEAGGCYRMPWMG